MNSPKRIDLTHEEMDALLQRLAAASLQDGDYEILKAIVEAFIILNQAVDEKTTSIKRLLRILFGAGTEKTKNGLI